MNRRTLAVLAWTAALAACASSGGTAGGAGAMGGTGGAGAVGVMGGGPSAAAMSPAARFRYPQPDSATVLHLLNRLTFGPRPGDVARVQRMGIAAWLDEQLAPERIRDSAEQVARRQYAAAFLSPAELYRLYPPPNQAQQAALRARQDAARPGQMQRPDSMAPPQPAGQRLLAGEVGMATLARHVESERQLLEVMSDFWLNHFNVFIGKPQVRWSVGDYLERAIRPNALGRFEDLLRAVARHPAMLAYLDNALSVAPGSQPPIPALAGRGRRALARSLTPEQEERLRQAQARMPTGLNENYARELLELHTLGVDGGYTQQDVQNVARILTGWSMTGPGPLAGALAGGRGATGRPQPFSFEFRGWAHDRGEKQVLGERFPAGQGMEEGLRLLQMLASHPSTARHVSHKLCARLVADDPPDGCVDQAVAAWRRSGGEIRAVLRAIVESDDFWAEGSRRNKMKSPLEFVAGALRATGARPDSTPRLSLVLQQLGQPLFGQAVPTGYPETMEEWVNSGALLTRMNVALGIASGRLPGLSANLDAVIPATDDPDALVARVNAVVLGGHGSPNTLRVMREQIADLRDPRQARAMAVGLALGSPEFQVQ